MSTTDQMIVVGAAMAFGCIFKRQSPVTLALRASVGCKAAWLLAGEMVRGAWERRGRWQECKERVWRERT